MEFIAAKPEHLDRICLITDQAKAQMRALGIDQWQKGYPNREGWISDIEKGDARVAVEQGCVVGAFIFQREAEPSYEHIDGKWLTDGSSYAAIHRVCVADECKGKGLAGSMFHHCFHLAAQIPVRSVRIDTHPGNIPMQRALEKAGFQLCGQIRLAGGVDAGALRLAYERIL